MAKASKLLDDEAGEDSDGEDVDAKDSSEDDEDDDEQQLQKEGEGWIVQGDGTDEDDSNDEVVDEEAEKRKKRKRKKRKGRLDLDEDDLDLLEENTVRSPSWKPMQQSVRVPAADTSPLRTIWRVLGPVAGVWHCQWQAHGTAYLAEFDGDLGVVSRLRAAQPEHRTCAGQKSEAAPPAGEEGGGGDGAEGA